MAYNTGNPLGSSDPRDLRDNSENIDVMLNSTTETSHPDRIGTSRKTWHGMEIEFQDRMLGMAFTRVGTFAAGFTLTDARQVLLYETDGHEYGWTGAFPKVVPPASTPAGTGGVGAGAWVDRSDVTLRSDMNIVVKVFESVADMVADAVLIVGQKCRTLGYYAVGDGGGNDYEIVAAATGTDDGGSYIDLSGSGFQAKGLFSLGIVNPNQFGAHGNGVIDDSTSISAFIEYCTAVGVSGYCITGSKFLIGVQYSRTFSSNEVLHIDWAGSEIIQADDNGIMGLTNSADISAVSAIVAADYDLSVTGGVTTRVSKITSAGHTFVVGDIGKIFSDDLVPDNENANQFIGEYLLVAAVVGDDIYTSSPLIETYSTNIKIAKPSNAIISFSGMSVKSTISDLINASCVTIQGFIRPSIRQQTFDNINAVALSITGCYQAEVDSISGEYIKNRPDLASYGYLVNDSSSFQTTVRNIRCSYARHAYTTTSASSVAADDKWYLRGRTMFSEVTDGKAVGCANAFDTHFPALGILFNACHSRGDYRGYDTGGAGFQLRGNYCKIRNCSSAGSKLGIGITAALRPGIHVSYIENFDYDGPIGDNIPISINGYSGANKANIYFNGAVKVQGAKVFDVTEAVLNISNLNVINATATSSSTIVYLSSDAIVNWDSGSVDWGQASLSSHNLVTHASATTEAYVRNVHVTGNSGKMTYLGRVDGYDVESHFDNIRLESTITSAFLSTVVGSNWQTAAYRVGYRSVPLGYRALTYGIAGNKDVDLGWSGHECIAIRVTISIAGVAINTMTKGAFAGQRCIFNNHTSSTDSFTISGGLLSLGAGYSVPVGKGVQLIWDGSTWRLGDQ